MANRDEISQDDGWLNDDDRRLKEDDQRTLMEYVRFRDAATYVAAAFATVTTVKRVALFGSVASPPRAESRRRSRRRSLIHVPKDVDLAVWLDDTSDLDRLRRLRSRAVGRLLNDKDIGVAHHQVDVFLLDVHSIYLGRLCCFNQCPKHKLECRVEGCGKVPFLKQHDAFVLDADSLLADRIQVLYERDQPTAS